MMSSGPRCAFGQGHRGEYSSLTAVAAVVAKQLGVGKESVRRWAIQAGEAGTVSFSVSEPRRPTQGTNRFPRTYARHDPTSRGHSISLTGRD